MGGPSRSATGRSFRSGSTSTSLPCATSSSRSGLCSTKRLSPPPTTSSSAGRSEAGAAASSRDLGGCGGCGESSLLEPLSLIFNVASKPESGSSFAFANVVECDVLLWQDYSHDERTMSFADLLSLFVGEAITIRRPGVLGRKHANSRPAFYSGRAPIRAQTRDPHAAAELNSMMDDRFTIFHFHQPLPHTLRVVDWPKCGCCAARFYLQDPRTQLSHSPTDLRGTPGHASGNTILALERFAELRSKGFLDESEFSWH